MKNIFCFYLFTGTINSKIFLKKYNYFDKILFDKNIILCYNVYVVVRQSLSTSLAVQSGSYSFPAESKFLAVKEKEKLNKNEKINIKEKIYEKRI